MVEIRPVCSGRTMSFVASINAINHKALIALRRIKLLRLPMSVRRIFYSVHFCMRVTVCCVHELMVFGPAAEAASLPDHQNQIGNQKCVLFTGAYVCVGIRND